MSTITIKTDESPAKTTNSTHKKQTKKANQNDTITIHTDSPRVKRRKNLTLFGRVPNKLALAVGNTQVSADTKIISVLDPKETKHHIVTHWQAYSPQQVLKLMRQMYSNLGTLSSQLSNLKNLLSSQKPSPPSEFLDALKLKKSEYKQLREDYREKRDKEGFTLAVVNDADKLVSQALEMLTSDDFRILWPAAVLCSGLRPIEILTVDIKPSVTGETPPRQLVGVYQYM